jgi:hypothetical protein
MSSFAEAGTQGDVDGLAGNHDRFAVARASAATEAQRTEVHPSPQSPGLKCGCRVVLALRFQRVICSLVGCLLEFIQARLAMRNM